MKITIPDTVLRNGEVVNISQDKEAEKKPTIISDTDPLFIQDEKGIWVKNPDPKSELTPVSKTYYSQYIERSHTRRLHSSCLCD